MDDMLSKSQSIWGYETNFGSFAEYTCVNQRQLLKKPSQLAWPEAGSYMLTLATAYRMLISENGAQIKPGERCLIWGASGGLGAFAIQLCNLVGAIPVGVVSSASKKEYCLSLGCKYVINLGDIGSPSFVQNDGEPNYLAWRKFKNDVVKGAGSEIDVVFEHIGRETMGLSVYLMRRGGRVVTCAASSGFMAQIDLRYLWMELKRIIGSHFANSIEAAAANQLVADGKIKTTAESIITFEEIPAYMDKMYLRKNVLGKVAVRL
jgi:crotonyl-CoA carboxylase/reductase